MQMYIMAEGAWFKSELKKLKYLEGTEPDVWLNNATNHLVIITMEEDDGPDEYYLTQGQLNGKLSKQNQIKISDLQPEWSEKSLLSKGYTKLKNPKLEEIYNEVLDS